MLIAGPLPAWMTVNVWPAIVSVPVRCADDGLAATEYVTVPLPRPGAPDVMLMKPSLLPAVQPQLEGSLTLTDAVVDPADTLAPFDDSENEQETPDG